MGGVTNVEFFGFMSMLAQALRLCLELMAALKCREQWGGGEGGGSQCGKLVEMGRL